MSRFFVPPENVEDSIIFIDDREDLHHMIKVLRLNPGDEIDVSDSKEWEYRASIVSLDSNGAEARILDKQKFAREPDIKLTLFQGIPKQGKMETIIQKTVELGVNRIVPVFMARTVVVDKGNFGKKLQRWQRVAAEAVKQCKRGIIPQIEKSVKTAAAVESFSQFDLVLFPYENERGTTIKDVLRDSAFISTSSMQNGGCAAESGRSAPKNIAVIIGPEGGFADEEAAAIISAGGKAVSLGRTILRTETAGMAAIAMIMYELEL